MPITSAGFTRPTQDQIETDFKNRFAAKFTVGGVTPSTEPEDFLGILSSVLAQMKNDLWEDVENCYYAGFVTTASGVDLERQAYPVPIRPATVSTILTQRFTGDNGQAIGLGFVVEATDGRQYKTTATGTIPVGGYVDLPMESVLTGIAQNAPINAVRFVPNPLPGLASSTNLSPALNGADIQSETDYRTEVISQRATDLTSALQSIINRVRNVTGVIDAFGAENVDAVNPDSAGRPPKSFEIIVDGGADAGVATAIFAGKAAGIKSVGSVLTHVVDEKGDPQEVRFSRVTSKEVFVEVIVTIGAGYNSATAQPVIRQKILEYIGGVDPLSVTFRGLGIGQKVYGWKVEAVLFDITESVSLSGIDGISILLGYTSGTINQTNLAIAASERPFTDFADILITEV